MWARPPPLTPSPAGSLPGISHLDDAACPGVPRVKNALSESVFRLALERADEQRSRDELCRPAQVLAAVERAEIGPLAWANEDEKPTVDRQKLRADSDR